MYDKIQVVIVDDHSLLREGVASILEKVPDFHVVGQGSSGDDAVSLSHDFQPNLVLLDIDMAGKDLATARRISAQCPLTRIIFLIISETNDSSIKRLSSDGCALILKDLDTPDLVHILRAVACGESYLPRALAACLLYEYNRLMAIPNPKHSALMNLTLIERKILEYLSTSLAYPEISQLLLLSDVQIRRIVAGILRKLKLRDRVEPVAFLANKHPRPQPGAYLAIELGKK